MSQINNYGIKGVGPRIQLGKKGGHLVFDKTLADGPAFQFRNVADDALTRVQADAPIANVDLTNKQYVDDLIDYLDKKFDGQLQGLNLKDACRVATTGNIALTGTIPLNVDSVSLIAGDRVLVKDQTNQTENGIYDVTIDGSTYTLVRSADANNVRDTAGGSTANVELTGGSFTFITDGATWGSTGWVVGVPSGLVTIGTDPVEWTQFSAAGVFDAGAGLLKTGTIFSVKVDNTTLYVNALGNIAIKSNAAAGNVMVSSGNGDGYWSTIDLADQGFVGASVLGVQNGGTGISSIAAGDLIVGSTGNAMTKLTLGGAGALLTSNGTDLGWLPSGTADQVLVTDGTALSWASPFYASLRGSAGNTILSGTDTTGTNVLTVSNNTAGLPVIIGSQGETNVNIEIAPAGDGLLVHSATYAFSPTSPANAFAPKSYVDDRVDAISTSRIENAAGTTAFDTAKVGFDDQSVIESRGKVLATFSAHETLATAGERLVVTHTDAEVRVGTANASGIGNVNLRLLMQEDGQLYIGTTGNGLISSEPDYGMTVRGGQGVTVDAGDIVIVGGAGTLNHSGGSAIIRGGAGAGTGENGSVQLQDSNGNLIVLARSSDIAATDYLEINNSSTGSPSIAGVGDSLHVGITFAPKGDGVVRVSDGAAYYAVLQQAGNTDAFVTKQYVANTLGGSIKTAGTGLTDVSNTFNVNVNATTIKVDSNDDLIVNSNATAGHILKSTGLAGTEAVWGTIDLSNTNSVSGILSTASGGTGYSTYAQYDLLVGSAAGGLNKLTKGLDKQVLGVSNTGVLSYQYISNLLDATGTTLVEGVGVSSAVNHLSINNAIADGAVVIGTSGANTNIPLMFSPKGTGLLLAKSGYTGNLTSGASADALVTKGYVDENILQSVSGGIRRQVISADSVNSSFAVSTPLPTIAGKEIYVTKVVMNVSTEFVGAVYAVLTAGATTLMNGDESDIEVAGSYIAFTDMLANNSGQQMTIQFFDASDQPVIPTVGSATILIEYSVK